MAPDTLQAPRPKGDDYLDCCMDVDAHEMAPVHKWPEIFGEQAIELTKMSEGLEILKNAGANSLCRPEILADDAPISRVAVWQERGCQAPSAIDLERRVEVMDLMGIERQLVFPGFAFLATLLMFNPYAPMVYNFDPKTFDHISAAKKAIGAHNDWCIRLTRELGGRLRPAAMLLTENLDQMCRDAQELFDRGTRAVMIPNGVPPADMSPADARMDRFWRLFEEAEVPVLFHIGTEPALMRSTRWDENVPVFESALSLEAGIQPFWGSTISFASEAFLAAMVLGGVFERFPGLRLGSLEIGAQWLGPFAERLDLWSGVFKKRFDNFLSMKPSEYINRNVRVSSFPFEDVASYFDRHPNLQNCYCYASDYPHIEGGRDSKKLMSDKLRDAGEDIRRKFFRENGLLLLPA